jgi:carboxypeptidase family protein
MKSWLSFGSAVTLVFFCIACQGRSTTAPTPQSSPAATKSALYVSGVVKDNISRPLAGATVSVAQAARLQTITGADGHFVLEDSTPVDPTLTLQVFRDGYKPVSIPWSNNRDALLFMTPVDLLNIDGQYTVTITSDESCTQLPAAARSRTYVATFGPWPSNPMGFVAPLSGANLFPSYDKISGVTSNNAVRFFIDSWDANNWWLEDDPIIDRLDQTTYVSFDGIALSSALSSTDSIGATLDGTIAYCTASQDPANPNWPLRCPGALVECKSSQHRITLTKK